MSAPSARRVRVQSKTLAEALRRVMHASALDETRPILSTVLFEGDEKGLRLVAADNYRIAIATIPVFTPGPEVFGRVPVARSEIPMLKAFLRAQTRDRDIKLEPGDDGLRPHLTVSDAYRAVKLAVIDGTYPDYASIVVGRKNRRKAVGINPTYLVDAARALPKGLPMRILVPIAPLDPVVVEAEDYAEHIMPVRINQ